jgi:UDP-N-acetylglucosamine transferase subunit ALG13
LVKSIDEGISQNGFEEEIFAQIGDSSYQPNNFEYVKSLRKSEFDCWTLKASAIIGHAGIGTITTALDCNKPLLVMPRLKKYGEVVNDHQVAIARKFEELGLVLVMYSVEELPEKIKQLKTFTPKARESQAQLVVQRIAKFLKKLSM